MSAFIKGLNGKCPCKSCQFPGPRFDPELGRDETVEEYEQRKNLARLQRRYNRRSR